MDGFGEVLVGFASPKQEKIENRRKYNPPHVKIVINYFGRPSWMVLVRFWRGFGGVLRHQNKKR